MKTKSKTKPKTKNDNLVFKGLLVDRKIWKRMKNKAEDDGRTVRHVVSSLVLRYAKGEIEVE